MNKTLKQVISKSRSCHEQIKNKHDINNQNNRNNNHNDNSNNHNSNKIYKNNNNNETTLMRCDTIETNLVSW